jgi:2-polyprenyl-3-methyl-5-hydroxy-6-metoxy-1,4-benzoquinol methylase
MLQPTIRYYDENATLAARESLEKLDTEGLQAFVNSLPPHARVLDAGCGAGYAMQWLRDQGGCEVEGVDASEKLIGLARTRGLTASCRDLRLLSVPRESFDGIWCSRTLPHLTIDECQRALASFFQALKPRTGMLFASFIEGTGERSEPFTHDGAPMRTFHFFTENAFLSLLRQSGFSLVARGERKDPASGERWIAVVARRA